jgi:hypothetical protein
VGLLLMAAPPHAAHAQPWQSPLAGSDWPWSAPQQPHPAVARITVPQRANVIAFGSGTLIDANDKLGLVITNWHVVDGAAGEIMVAFPDGFRSGGRVLKVDRDWDLAALAIWKPRVQPVPLSSQPPRSGDMLTIAGYGQGNYRAASGRCTQYVAPGLKFPYEMIEVAAAARQGDSGGPIFNASGQLAGVLFGEGGGRTSGSYCRRVQQFLSTIALPAGGLGPPPAAGASPRGSNLPPAAAPAEPDWRPVTPAQAPARSAAAPNQVFASAITASPREPLTANEPARPQSPPPPVQMAQESNLYPPVAPAADPAMDSPPNRFRAQAAPSAAAASPAASSAADSIWSQLVGIEPLEQIKAALAVVGAMALAMHGFRWLRSG